jgi:hypothetical protein
MARIYTPQVLLILPRLNAPYSYILCTRMVTAASSQQDAGQVLPDFLLRPLARLTSATQALGLALQLEPPGEASATREADAAFDDAWGGLYDFLSACLKLRPGLNPDPAGTRALMDFLFPEGTSFLTKKYLEEWQESQARLDALFDPANKSYLDTLATLGGQLQLTNVQQAHAELGQVLGITTVLPAQPSSRVRETMLEALDKLRVYACKVVAWPDPDVDGSQALADALIEPLASWEDYQRTGSGSSDTAGEAGSSAAATGDAGSSA